MLYAPDATLLTILLRGASVQGALLAIVGLPMGGYQHTLISGIFLVMIVVADPAAAADADINGRRHELISAMLRSDFTPLMIAGVRRVCAAGREPADVAEDRAKGADFTPDAADTCITALDRAAQDGNLPDLYRKLLSDAGASSDGFAKFPEAIGIAVLHGSDQVKTSDGHVVTVAPALAFDAGFSAAYQEGRAASANEVNEGQLKSLAEACLGQQQDPGTCFSAGYAFGARAISKP